MRPPEFRPWSQVPKNSKEDKPQRKAHASQNDTVKEKCETDEINFATKSQPTSKIKLQIRALVAPRRQAVAVIWAGI